MNKNRPFKTYVICDNCRRLSHKWYTIDDNDLCIFCHSELYPEKMTQFDYDLLEEEEENNNGQ